MAAVIVSSCVPLRAGDLQSPAKLPAAEFEARLDPLQRAKLVQQFGGNEDTEKAVTLALAWLVRRQLPDGGWDFTTPESSGSLTNGRNAATGMALLPFLAAGHTHQRGDFQQQVDKGLAYLMTVIKPNGSLIDGGNMYSHGIASICLTEAYAMTGDKQLKAPAQSALNFIMSAQHADGGGWRYVPGQAGDTSVFGWQLAALKTGTYGSLTINPATIARAARFLDGVQSNDGANYGYTSPGKGTATTAIGLLSRMQMGWKKDRPELQQGVEFLSRVGPSRQNLYFDYYATQVLRQYGGETWQKWNETLREQLVRSQETADGPQQGSWRIVGDHGSERGGRLYCTAMCCLMLESYYRHPPLYRQEP
jgi:hypothetical protein